MLNVVSSQVTGGREVLVRDRKCRYSRNLTVGRNNILRIYSRDTENKLRL